MIKKVEISGYRLLDGFEADLDNLTVIIGANATGKSTLFDCLSLIVGCTDLPIDTLLRTRGGAATLLSADGAASGISWKLTFSKPTVPAVWNSFPLDSDRDYVYEVRLGADTYAYGPASPLYECLRNAQPHVGHVEPFKLLEATPARSMIFDHRQKIVCRKVKHFVQRYPLGDWVLSPVFSTGDCTVFHESR